MPKSSFKAGYVVNDADYGDTRRNLPQQTIKHFGESSGGSMLIVDAETYQVDEISGVNRAVAENFLDNLRNQTPEKPLWANHIILGSGMLTAKEVQHREWLIKFNLYI